MSNEGHHPVLRTIVGGGWSATVTVSEKTYHVEGEYPTEVVYNLAVLLADDLATSVEAGSLLRRALDKASAPVPDIWPTTMVAAPIKTFRLLASSAGHGYSTRRGIR